MKAPVKRGKSQPSVRHEDGSRLTTPDLVLLSLLAERPMHGYEANATLENRKIRDWAAVSRPQVYYSLDKLTRLGLIRVTEDPSSSAGPERRVFQTTEAGRDRLADALEAPRWTHTKVHPPFLTWLSLSWQARPRAFAQQLKRRRQYLEAKLVEEKETLDDVLKEVGHPYHEAVWMLKLAIAQIELELKWLDQIERDTPKRAPARKAKR
ncbi:MAG TPA: PadR family transcriptional regulator [Pyrinomonadaceae bacterium]|nr:PadR family transcriptional regulator [Pyrinomonadaceae bacterium]